MHRFKLHFVSTEPDHPFSGSKKRISCFRRSVPNMSACRHLKDGQCDLRGIGKKLPGKFPDAEPYIPGLPRQK